MIGDPTKEEMLNVLNKHHFDIFHSEAAIYWFASDYHGGQWTNLYSVLSTSQFKPGLLHKSVKDEGELAEIAYNALVEEFI